MTEELPDVIDRLRIVLEAEEETHGRMRALLRREEVELIELDPAKLEATTAEKQSIAAEARLQEQARIALMRTLAELLGLPPSTRLSELITALGPDAGPLTDLHARLSALVQATRDLLASNELFAKRSLGRVQETLRLLGQAVPEAPAYGPSRANEPRSGRGRLVRAAI